MHWSYFYEFLAISCMLNLHIKSVTLIHAMLSLNYPTYKISYNYLTYKISYNTEVDLYMISLANAIIT